MGKIIPTNPADPVLGFCEAEREWLVSEIERLVVAESPSTDKVALDACSALLAERLNGLGGRITWVAGDHGGDHLRAEFGGGDTRRQVLLLGHFDTVWPVGQLARMPLRREGDRLYGPGVYDMKAGIGIAMLAIRALTLGPPLPIRVVMLWTSDEEVGSTSSRPAIENEAMRSEAVFVLEPALAGGALKTARKGVGRYELIVRGISAHAGAEPPEGASAVHELARQILHIVGLQDVSRGTSLNVGVVTGGTRPNVVAEEARATVDVRAWTRADAEDLDRSLRSLRPGGGSTSLELRGGFERPPLERSEAVVRLFGLARTVAERCGRYLEEGSTGGASDGNFTAALGVPTLDGLGAVGRGAHAASEHVEVSQLPWRAALLAGLIRRVAELPLNSR